MEGIMTPTIGMVFGKAYQRIVVKAGVDLQKVQGHGTRMVSKRTFHALRHTFTSGLANANVPPERRRVLTGHTANRSPTVLASRIWSAAPGRGRTAGARRLAPQQRPAFPVALRQLYGVARLDGMRLAIGLPERGRAGPAQVGLDQ